MQTVGFRCPVGFINYPPYLSGSTEILTPAATRSGSEGRRKPSLGAAIQDSMTDSETQRQECSEEYDYRESARFLSEFLLRRSHFDVDAEMGQLVSDLHSDQYIEQDQLRETAEALGHALDAVEAVAAAQEGTSPPGVAGNPKRWGCVDGGVPTE